VKHVDLQVYPFPSLSSSVFEPMAASRIVRNHRATRFASAPPAPSPPRHAHLRAGSVRGHAHLRAGSRAFTRFSPAGNGIRDGPWRSIAPRRSRNHCTPLCHPQVTRPTVVRGVHPPPRRAVPVAGNTTEGRRTNVRHRCGRHRSPRSPRSPRTERAPAQPWQSARARFHERRRRWGLRWVSHPLAAAAAHVSAPHDPERAFHGGISYPHEHDGNLRRSEPKVG